MASLEPSESVTVRLYPKVPPNQQSIYPGRAWCKDQQNSSVLCSPPRWEIHTSEYFHLLKIRLNSHFLQLEAEGKRKALKHCQLWYCLTTIIQEPASHLLQTVPPTEAKVQFTFPPACTGHLHSSFSASSEHSTSFTKENATLALYICKVHFSYATLSAFWWSLPLSKALYSTTIFS